MVRQTNDDSKLILIILSLLKNPTIVSKNLGFGVKSSDWKNES